MCTAIQFQHTDIQNSHNIQKYYAFVQLWNNSTHDGQFNIHNNAQDDEMM